jgi:hypothetical protein
MKMIKTWRPTLTLTCVIGASAVALGAPEEAQLVKEAKVTKRQAETTALAKVPEGVIKSEEIEREHGKLIWSFDIAKTGTRDITEVQIDALTGNIRSMQIETPKDQMKESAADRAKRN